MTPAYLKELEDRAILAELARPLVHEVNNFLNNLLLQLAISAQASSEPLSTEWRNIRNEGKRLAGLLREWQRHRRSSANGTIEVDLNQIMLATVAELRSEAGEIGFVLQSAAEALMVRAFEGQVQCLCSLVLRHAITAVSSNPVAETAIEIQLERNRERTVLRLFETGRGAEAAWEAFADSGAGPGVCLTALACKSLVEQLHATIHVETLPAGRSALVIEFPLADWSNQ